MSKFSNDHIKQFWDQKILGWEADRYEKTDLASKPLQLRMENARRWLSAQDTSGTFLELGAGSCRLLGDVLGHYPNRKYIGVDVSQSAITEAQKRAQQLSVTARCEFKVSTVADFEPGESSYVFSLGLLDWLSEEELKKMAQLSKGKKFLHSFSEKKPFSPLQIIHRLYTYLYYGWRNGNYCPRYHSRDEIQALFGEVDFVQLDGMGFAMFAQSRS